MKITSAFHWPNGRPKKFFNQDGTRKAMGAPPARPVGAPAAARPGTALAPRPASVGKSLPQVPEFHPMHPLSLSRDQVRGELDKLTDWLKSADGAPGSFTTAQAEKRHEVAERAELLRWYAWG